ncbi:oligosaccharide flippase family protein [Chitinimonas lacunae]|uniref:Oligosaccharide flippase family protein n=1 Tax=Chitinimonas lacunae TaxID=1963018 RepID=A0ABV8MWS8_9NEIS
MLARAWASQTLATLWVALVSMLLVFVLGRWLGPAGFGQYNYVLTVATLVAILQDGGFKTLLQRESASSGLGIDGERLLGFALGHLLWVTLAALLLVTVLGRPDSVAIAWAILALGLLAVANYLSACWRGQGHFGRDALWQVGLRSLTALTLLLALWLWQAGTEAAFAGWALGVALALLLVGFRARPQWRPPAAVYRAAGAFLLIDLATAVYFRIDIVLLRHCGIPDADIGRYAAAYRLFEGGVLLLAPAATVFFRELRLRWQDPLALRPVLRRALVGVTLVALLGAMLGFWLAPWVLRLAYGPGYEAAAPLLGWLLLAFLLVAPNYVLTQAAVALNRERLYALAVCVAAVVNIGLNLWLLPQVGVVGAAWASIGTELCLLLFLAWGVRSWL